MQDCIASVGPVNFGRHQLPSFTAAIFESQISSLFLIWLSFFTVFRDVLSGKMNPGGERYRLMTDNEGVLNSS